MKRILSLILIFALCLSLAGCIVLPVQELFDDEPEKPGPSVLETETAPVPETDEATEPTQEPTQPPIPQVTVNDAYMDTLHYTDFDEEEILCYHIPQFDIDTPEMESMNRAIYMELYEMLEENVYEYPEQPFFYGMYYDWVQVEDIVSLLVFIRADYGIQIFRVYNAYADGSGMVSREELIGRFGYDQDSFHALAEQKLEETYLSMFSQYPLGEDEFYHQQLENTVSYDNVESVVPFISNSGELCCVATIYSLAGADSYDNLINLTGSEDVPWPDCHMDHG